MDLKKHLLKSFHTEVIPMYITRDIENTIFLNWLTSNDTHPLFVHGAKQIGKTATVKHFAENYFNNIYYINLAYSNNPTLCFFIPKILLISFLFIIFH